MHLFNYRRGKAVAEHKVKIDPVMIYLLVLAVVAAAVVMVVIISLVSLVN